MISLLLKYSWNPEITPERIFKIACCLGSLIERCLISLKNSEEVSLAIGQVSARPTINILDTINSYPSGARGSFFTTPSIKQEDSVVISSADFHAFESEDVTV